MLGVLLVKDPAVASATAYIGPGGATVTENDGRVFITLKPHGERTATVDQVIARLDRALQPIQGIRLYMQAAQDINVGARHSKTQYQFTLVDVDSEELNHWAPLLLDELRALPSLTDVASDQQSAGRSLKIEVNCEVASRLGINPATVDGILYDAFGQRHIARIYTTLNQYYVILEVDPNYQLGPNALSRIDAKSATAGMVPLSQFATVKPSTAPLAVNHRGQFPSVTLSFNLVPNSTIGEAVAAVHKAVANLRLPASIATSFKGNAQAFQGSLSSTPILIMVALVAVYLILGMLYESIIHPLTIISTLPSAGLGALLTLMLFGMPLDVIGIIGIILLIGIVKKNGIMLVDVALVHQRERGLSSEDAVHQALPRAFPSHIDECALLGGVPLMLGTGTGSEIRQPLGYAMSAACWYRKFSPCSPHRWSIFTWTVCANSSPAQAQQRYLRPRRQPGSRARKSDFSLSVKGPDARTLQVQAFFNVELHSSLPIWVNGGPCKRIRESCRLLISIQAG